MHNRMNNTYSLQSKQKIKIKLLKNHNRTKGPKTKLEQKINNSVEIVIPKTYFQEAKLHKTHNQHNICSNENPKLK